MKRQGLKPRFRIGPALPAPGSARDAAWRSVLPFRRSWPAIGVLAVMDAVFLVPAVVTFRQAAEEWGRFESLFDLVAAVFLSAWLLGWSIAPLLLTGILVMMLFGREVIRVHPRAIELSLGLPLLSLTAIYDASKMRNLRHATPVAKSGSSWRGPHLAFEYGANSVEFGSELGAADAAEMVRRIETAAGSPIRRGAALPAEVEGPWEAGSPVPEANRPTLSAAEWENEPTTPRSASSILLIAANLVPVAGAAFLGWELSDVMVLYWAESAIIGFFNLCKIAIIGRWFALLAGPFFIGHFGGFMAVHFLFIYGLFVKGLEEGAARGGDLAEVAALFRALWPALAALFLSHAWSFVTNFLGRQEYRGRTLREQMSEPYSRIIFMHLVLIFGGGLSLALGGPTLVLIGVIGLKIWFDLRAHLRQHGKK